MTDKTTMPEPVAYRSKESPYLFILGGPEADGFEGLITTAQAEAYAQAKMREMSGAAKALADWAEHEVGAWPELTPGLQAIRALIPKETPCDT